MKRFKLLAVLTAFLFSGILSAQDEIGSSPSTNQPTAIEQQRGQFNEGDRFYPAYLDDQLKAAQESGNEIEAKRIMELMDSKIPAVNKFNAMDHKAGLEVPVQTGSVQPPFNSDWYSNDVTVYSGSVKFGDPYFRQ
ncbi:MAG TPA: hypothetical protein PKE39_07780, partial [Ignavibacteria bacterium]|nr:hypothetical protein [Ignavibacteria bacterium]HMQ98911.1 hypothetical protein [Ignavibacteria bacterium]